MVAALAAYIKLSIMVQLHGQSSNHLALFIAGVVVQLSSLIGALLFFVLVYFTDTYIIT